MSVSNTNFFFCYDKNLSRWLKDEKGHKYITHAIHPRTRNDFYLYESSQKLHEDIQIYRNSIEKRC